MEAQHQAEQVTQAKQRWVKPEVKKLEAGSAEDGFNNIPDGGQPS
jgi:hypothetical protein